MNPQAGAEELHMHNHFKRVKPDQIHFCDTGSWKPTSRRLAVIFFKFLDVFLSPNTDSGIIFLLLWFIWQKNIYALFDIKVWFGTFG